MLFPLVLGGVSIIGSIIGTFAVRGDNVERALYQALIVAGVISALLILPVTMWMMDKLPGIPAATSTCARWSASASPPRCS